MKKKLLKMSRRKVCKENVFKKTKKNRKKFMLWYSDRRGRGGNSN